MNAAPATLQAPRVAPFVAQTLEQVFSDCFRKRYNAILAGGYLEPLYQPATKTDQFNVLRYREDFFASALHEVAHWCIAGDDRRKQVDFGYWYAPDGRNASAQTAFEKVEYKPQTLEWFFAKACGYRFRISVDNLDAQGCQSFDANAFKHRVVAQAQHWLAHGLPADGDIFFKALCKKFGASDNLSTLHFPLAEIA